MRTFILRRLLFLIPMLIVISMLSFALMRLSPGNALDSMRINPQISKAHIDALEEKYGLNLPWYWAYLKWASHAVFLDFGESIHFKTSVAGLIGSRMWNTFLVSFTALVFSWIVAVPLGVLAALYKDSIFDRLCSFLAFSAFSIPEFFLALLALWFALMTGVFPTGGLYSAEYEFLTPLGKVADVMHHLILPTLVLGIGGVAGLLRYMRANFIETMQNEYVKTARAKGLSEFVVNFKHVLRNAINPLITVLGYSLGGLLSGAFLVENVLGLPGLGRLTYEAFLAKDDQLVMASIVMASFLLLMGNLVADILLAIVDPRIRHE